MTNEQAGKLAREILLTLPHFSVDGINDRARRTRLMLDTRYNQDVHILAAALAARERAVWEEIIKKYSSTYDTFIEKEKLLIWCRQQQAQAVKP